MARHASAWSASTSTTSSSWMTRSSYSMGTRARISGTLLASLPGRAGLTQRGGHGLFRRMTGLDHFPDVGRDSCSARAFLEGHLLHLSEREREPSSSPSFPFLLRRGLELGTRDGLALLGAERLAQRSRFGDGSRDPVLPGHGFRPARVVLAPVPVRGSVPDRVVWALLARI